MSILDLFRKRLHPTERWREDPKLALLANLDRFELNGVRFGDRFERLSFLGRSESRFFDYPSKGLCLDVEEGRFVRFMLALRPHVYLGSSSRVRHPPRSWIVAVAAGVLLWRGAAYVRPSSLVSIPDGLHLPFALLGALFLVSGISAWWARPDRWTAIFLVYGLCGGVHWGGAIGASHPALAMSLFLVYVGITALGDAALLHLALVYPKGRPLAQGWRVALYSPAAIALLLATVAGVAPQTILETGVAVLLLVANLFSLSAGIAFLVRLVTVDRGVRRAARLPLIVAGMVTGSVVALLGAGGALPGEPEAWNLVLGVIPITLAVALVSQSVESSIVVEAA